jgi:hypothetical protein
MATKMTKFCQCEYDYILLGTPTLTITWLKLQLLWHAIGRSLCISNDLEGEISFNIQSSRMIHPMCGTQEQIKFAV